MLSLGPTAWLVLATVMLVVFFLYQKSIPTPLPDIPYSKSAIRPFGDVWAAVKYQNETNQMTGFFIRKCRELESPIVQMFMEPFKKPWVLVADSVVAEDILTRRTKEFDVSPWFTGVFEAVVPNSHLHHKTNQEWRKKRRAVNDVMAGPFLHSVAGPRAYTACREMITLWTEKARLARQRPFNVNVDIEHMTLDQLWALSFGSSIGSTRGQIDLLTTLDGIPGEGTSSATFPEAPRPALYRTIDIISESHEIPIRSPVGPLHHKLAFILSPKLRRAKREKMALIDEKLATAWTTAISEKPGEIACAADSFIRREIMLAEKEGRPAKYNTPTLHDELYIFVQAGSETSATTLQWALKYLARNQVAQTKLRAALHKIHGNSQLPSSEQITRAHVPYLEATMEETLRCGVPVGVIARETQVDCNIMGYHIPAKTNVILTNCGPSYRSPSIPFPKDKLHLRPENQFTGDWESGSLSDFEPERWLHTNEDGKVTFSPRAGPSHAMGTGIRHCFGKPMAMLSLRVFLTLIILSFELQTIPAELEDFEPYQKMTHRPRTTYLRLRPLS